LAAGRVCACGHGKPEPPQLLKHEGWSDLGQRGPAGVQTFAPDRCPSAAIGVVAPQAHELGRRRARVLEGAGDIGTGRFSGPPRITIKWALRWSGAGWRGVLRFGSVALHPRNEFLIARCCGAL